MPNLLTENAPALFSALQSNIGDEVAYTPHGGSASTFTAIVSEPRPLEFSGGGGRTVVIFKIPKSDMDAASVTPARNDSIEYNAATFTVIDVTTSPLGLVSLFTQRK